MANQIVVSAGAKVRNLQDVIIGTSGVLTSLGFDVANGVPRLDVNGKILVSQLPNSVMEYKGTWNAATNTPTLVNGTGNQGDVYLCNVAGTVDFGAGAIAFVVGDQVIYSGSIWQRASGATGTVTSVAITESGDSLNITGSPITTSGTINIGFNGTNLQYVNGAGNLTTFPILTGYVTAVSGTAPVVSSGGTTPAISMAAATSSVDGYLTSADFTTFNNKQNAITLTTTGTSGASTLVGATLNIPNYGSALTGYVPYTGATTNVDLGTFNLTADVITGATGSFTSNGGSDTFAINHSSGAGIALNITKGGSGEGLYINKTSGSGNAATIIGTLNATTLVKSGGTSSQYLMADGSVSTLTNPITGTGTSGQVAYFNGTSSLTSNAAFAFTPTSQLLVNNSVTAASAIARGTNLTPTLTAAANSDVLVGLDINPTFTNGAFTGVQNTALRANGNGIINGNFSISQSFTVPYSGVSATVYGSLELGTYNGTFADGNLIVRGYAALGGISKGSWGAVGSNYYLTGVANSLVRRNADFVSIMDMQSGGFQWKTAPSSTANSVITLSELMRLNANGNLLLNTTTDAGFRLDVNGTARVQSSLEVVSVNAGSSLIQQWSYSSAPSAYRLQLNTNVSTGIVKYSFDLLNNSTSFSNNLVLDRGNIGIGQISPLRRLDVASDGTNWGSAIFGGAGGTDKIQIGNLSSVATIAAVNSAASAFTNISIAPQGGNVLIGTSTDVASAVLQVSSTTKGFLPPRMTSAQRTAISSPATGLIVYQTDGVEGLWLRTSTGWVELTVV
jgi:hypothetical protein